MSLRNLFIITALTALVCAVVLGVERTWFGPAREGIEAQKQFDDIIKTHNWQGQIITLHFFGEVRILIHQVAEKELEEIFPVLHNISWLQVIRIDAPKLSEDALRRWREQFPNCKLVVDSEV